MKYDKGFTPIILIAIIVGALIIGGGAYYFGKSSSNAEKEAKIEENQNKDIYPKVFEYGNKENQLHIALSELGDHPAPEILNINENGSILFHDKGYGLKIFSKKDGRLNYTTENISPFRYACIDNEENIYVLDDLNNSDVLPIVKYDKKGNVLGFLNNNNLRSLIQPNSGPLFDKIYISNNDLYLYGSGSEDSYKISSLDNFKGLDNLQKVSGKYGVSGDLFYTEINMKENSAYLEIKKSNGDEKKFSFEIDKIAGFFFLNEDKEGNVYIEADLCFGSGWGGDGDNYCIRKVYKINKTDGNVIGIKELPKPYSDYLSYNDLLVDNGGNIFYLNLQKDKAYLEKYTIN